MSLSCYLTKLLMVFEVVSYRTNFPKSIISNYVRNTYAIRNGKEHILVKINKRVR